MGHTHESSGRAADQDIERYRIGPASVAIAAGVRGRGADVVGAALSYDASRA